MTSHADRAHIKRAMSIGEYPGENDLNANEFRVATYICVDGEKYSVVGSDGDFCTWVPGGAVCGETLEKLREAVIAALAEKEMPVPQPTYSVGLKPWSPAALVEIHNQRRNEMFRRLDELSGTISGKCKI